MFRPTLIMKPVGVSCNLMCGYCYNNPQRTTVQRITRMSQEVLNRVVEEFAQLDIQQILFIWHGGEPLLAGLEFYQDVLYAQQLLRERGVRVRNSIQTNGTLLTQEWVDYLKTRKFRVGISLDGPQHVHDLHRVDLAGNGSFGRVYDALKMLQAAQIRLGLNVVVTKTSLPYAMEIYDFLKQESVTSYDLSPCAEIDVETGVLLPFSVTPQEYASFMRMIFDKWFEDDDPMVRVRLFSEFIQGVIGGCQRLCTFRRVCYEYFAIDYNGDIYVCGRFMDSKKTLLGNLMEIPLKELLAGRRYQAIKAEVLTVKPECQSCRWSQTCNGGCSYYRFLRSGSLGGPNYFCRAYRTLFEHAEERIRPLMTTGA